MRKIVFGITVVSAGVLLVLFNMNILPPEYKHIIFSWPMLLIAIGVINLFGRKSWVPGVILIAIGGFFIAPMLYVFPFDFARIFWPGLLVLAGVLIIFKNPKKTFQRRWESKSNSEFKLEDGYIEESNVFSGSKRIIQPMEFKGGKISNLFGGSEIDLTQTTLAPGTNVLELDCVFGGVSLVVPSDWEVQITLKSVMGGFVDKRRYFKPNGGTGKLIISGKAVFGGGEIKSI